MKKRITALILVICMALLLSPSMMASGNVYPLTARITGEGKIIAEDAAYEAGDEVEFILRPASGWEVYSLDVSDYFGNYIEWEENTDGSYSFEMPDNLVAITVVFKEMSGPKADEDTSVFSDVPSDSKYYDAVMFVYENEIFKGMDSTTFAPDAPLSRGMLVTVLYRIAGEPNMNDESAFSDVSSDAYYAKASVWAEKNGIVTGYGDGTFGPDDNVTREQMTAIIWRFAGRPAPMSDNIVLIEVSDYAEEAMRWAVENEMITPDYTRAYATRADASYMLWKLLK